MDTQKLRKIMVEHQLRRRGIENERVLDAFLKVPRERFVPEQLRESAYEDHPLPIGEGQTISQPYMVALMSECLELKKDDKVLEIGTGSGYQTAILARLAKEVYSIERFESLAEKAEERLSGLGYANVKIKTGDGTQGWEEFSPFKGIIVTAAAPEIPRPLLEQLDLNGRMLIPLGGTFSQLLTKILKVNKDKVERTEICGCVFVPLIGKYGWKE